MGAQLAEQFRGGNPSIGNMRVQDWLEKLGLRLALELPEPKFTYTFAVIAGDGAGPTHEASVLPGGYVFVPAGLILEAREGAEFAGMLAHAMAHAAERHYTRMLTQNEVTKMATDTVQLPVAFRGATLPQMIALSDARFEREFEAEADTLAVQMLAGAGYDPNALARYVGRAATTNPRVAQLNDAIGKLQGRAGGPEFGAIQEEVRQLAKQFEGRFAL